MKAGGGLTAAHWRGLTAARKNRLNEQLLPSICERSEPAQEYNGVMRLAWRFTRKGKLPAWRGVFAGFAPGRGVRLTRVWVQRSRRRLMSFTAMELARRTWRELGDDFAVDLAGIDFLLRDTFPVPVGHCPRQPVQPHTRGGRGGSGSRQVLPHVPARFGHNLPCQRGGGGRHPRPAGGCSAFWVWYGRPVSCSGR